MKKHCCLIMLLMAFVAAPPAATCAWNSIRQSDAPLAVVYVSTGAYELSYTVGDNCASLGELAGVSAGLWSGYLSLVPADVVGGGLLSAASTSTVTGDGGLWGMTPGESLDLNFSSEILPSVSTSEIKVTQLYDNTGAVANSTWPVTLTYSREKLVLAPTAAWPKGSVFSVYLSSSILDISGAPVTEGSTVYFSVIMDYQAENTAAAFSDRRVRVNIPANAYSRDFFVALSTDASAAPVEAANSRLPGMPGAPEFINTVRVSPYDSAGNTLQPDGPCVLTLPYPDSDGDGFIDGTARRRVSSLSVWHLDEAAGLWSRQAGASIDTAARTVSQAVPHFSNYALLALANTDLSPVYVSPVPFRPNAGDSARYGNWADLIAFRNLPGSGRIRIYTLSGALVRELPVAAATVTWDVRNSGGQVVSSGVYLWEVTAGSSRKTGKLVVIK